MPGRSRWYVAASVPHMAANWAPAPSPPPLLTRARRLAPVVVFDAPLALLLLGERDVEVGVEVAAE